MTTSHVTTFGCFLTPHRLRRPEPREHLEALGLELRLRSKVPLPARAPTVALTGLVHTTSTFEYHGSHHGHTVELNLIFELAAHRRPRACAELAVLAYFAWAQGITSPQKPSAVLPRAVMPVHGTGRVRRLLLVVVP